MEILNSKIVQNIAKYIVLGVIFILSFVAFLPKENIYFYFLEKLKTQNIQIQNEKTTSGFFDFTLSDGDLFYHDIKALHIEKLNINSLIIKTNLNFENIVFDGNLIDNLDISYNIFTPNIFDIKINGASLKGYGTYNKGNKKLILFLKPSKKIIDRYLMIFSQSEILKSGEYKIEYNL